MSGQVWPFPLDCDVAINTAGTNVPAVIVYRKAFFIMYRKTNTAEFGMLVEYYLINFF